MQRAARTFLWRGIAFMPLLLFSLRPLLGTSLTLRVFFIACCGALVLCIWRWHTQNKPWWPILMGMGVALGLVVFLMSMR